MEPDILWLDPQDLAKPENGIYRHYVDYWWVANKEGLVAVYQMRSRLSPYANSDRHVTEALANAISVEYDHLVQLPVAFIKETL